MMDALEDQWWAHRLDPAGPVQRLFAALVDVLLVVASVTAVYWFFRGFDDVFHRYFDPALRDSLPAGVFEETLVKIAGLSLMSFLVYCVLFEPAPWSGTLGKRLVGIRVVDEYGERLTLTASIVRNLVKLVSVAAAGVGVMAMFWRPGRQAWHDRLARSFVAKG